MHSKDQNCHEDYQKTADWLLSHTQHRPKVAIICGSGLGLLADALKCQDFFKYSDIPSFPQSTGHFSTDSYSCGDLMIIRDHINFPGLAGLNPLNGPNDDKFGPRFPPMSGVYDKGLRKMAFDICKTMGISQYVQEGVYCMVGGPNFESIAEARLLHRLDVDAVGMSTAPEVLVASHCGMKVFGLSLITNKVVKSYEDNETVNHEAVLEVSKMRSETLQTLVTELISRMDINNNNTV
ncbi:purine nucleoside phosphorylase 4a [Triplophysa rosa]|uniref:purine-nucleoside phosphorylase n=1 Tax=Triplophysa rosa TaxID=992332 RepID=A0A9W7TF03_TRIRA|nr:purine nucleoside phosphorylase 4a [Triplophysa rosa]